MLLIIELQRKAARQGLGYQTYVSSIIHKFINGRLTEVNPEPETKVS